MRHVAAGIRRTQEILERRIVVGNASFYLAPSISELSEAVLIRVVLEEADCTWM